MKNKWTGGWTIDSLSIFNIDFITSGIHLSLSKNDASDFGDENSYFVSVGFFDGDSSYVFGHSFCSDEGFSLGGVRTDLQAKEMRVKNLGEGAYTMTGEDKVAIHQAFMYNSEDNPSLNIQYVVVSISHMGAG